MKKIISFILVAFIMLGICVLPSYSIADKVFVFDMDTEEGRGIINAPAQKVILGDVNGDRQLNIRDSYYLRLYILDYSIEAERFALDINNDNSVNLRDSFALQLLILNKIERAFYDNYCANISYNEALSTLELEAFDIGDGKAFFEIDLSYADISDMNYCAVVLSGNTSNAVSIADRKYILKECTDVEAVGDGEYTYLLFSLTDTNTSKKLIEIVYNESVAIGDKLGIDSVIFAESREAAVSEADNRLAERNAESEAAYTELVFEAAALTEANGISFGMANDGLKLTSVGSEDTYAIFSLEEMQVSADENKFAVFTSMLEVSNTQVALTGKISFYLESGYEYSTEYSLINDGVYHSVVVDFTEAENWTGNIASIKINNLTEPSNGLSSYIKDIKFCNSLWDAKKLRVGFDASTVDSRLLYTYGFYEEGEYSMAYRYYIPEGYTEGISYPLFTILHGASYRGNDNVRPIQAGFPLLLDSTSDVARESIIFAPQCPEDTAWVEIEFSDAVYSIEETPESKANIMLLRMLEKLQGRFSVDSDRLYVTGFSMGGYGVWDLLSRHGEIFAAGMPLCGGGDKSYAEQLADISIWAFHGTSDPTVPVRGTRVMYNAIVKAGGTKITYTPLDGYAHNIWDTVYANEEYISWMFSQRLSERAEQ